MQPLLGNMSNYWRKMGCECQFSCYISPTTHLMNNHFCFIFVQFTHRGQLGLFQLVTSIYNFLFPQEGAQNARAQRWEATAQLFRTQMSFTQHCKIADLDLCGSKTVVERRLPLVRDFPPFPEEAILKMEHWSKFSAGCISI